MNMSLLSGNWGKDKKPDLEEPQTPGRLVLSLIGIKIIGGASVESPVKEQTKEEKKKESRVKRLSRSLSRSWSTDGKHEEETVC